MPDTDEQSIQMLARINKQLRGAVSACFPCAYEQYVTIQMPGTIIDTRLGGSYLPKGDRATADTQNKIQCNEAMLVDSMVPLDKIMLGPTGKSVTRSYTTALDMLIPRKTDIGSVDVELDLSGDGASKYSQAMRFLRSKETLLTPKSEIVGSRVRGSKDKLEANGISGTVVDRYVEKQIAWSEARGKWDAVRSEALEARESREDQQSAALFSARQKDIKRAQGELHARWMDWVVNGDKFRVEYCFSIVDRDSIMARIEKGREATRDAMITSIDGTEWAQVTLEPRNWAQICRAKAIDWKTRNPANPAHLQLRLESLKRMKNAYQVYEDQLAHRSVLREPTKTWEAVKIEYETADQKFNEAKKEYDSAKDEKQKAAAEDKLKEPTQALSSIKPLYDAMNKVEAAKKELEEVDSKDKIVQSGSDESAKAASATAKARANDKYTKLKDDAAYAENQGSLRAGQENALKEALKDMYKYEEQIRDAQKSKDTDTEKDARRELEASKTRWQSAKKALQAIGTKDSVQSLQADGIETMKTAIDGHLRSIDGDIITLQAQLGSTGAGLANAPNVIVGVAEDKDQTLIRASDDTTTQIGAPTAALGEESSDVWTKVAFSVGSQSDTSSTKELQVSGSASVEVGSWWASVKASTSFSSSSKKVESAMSSCSVDGSFSAMVVNIKRPWLHSDLFHDFDIDIAENSKLSPGAAQIKNWVENGDAETGANKRTEYGKFPAYPTAFIVAADTVLEFKSIESDSKEMMSALSTDSSIQASYGPWGLKGGASLKTDTKESSQKMEVKDGSLRISFQAPQIIGWVSEILPLLPRGRGATMGGLTAPPTMAFRI